MTENEKLRALLAEARTRLLQTFGYGLDIDGNLSSRIDAALAEPVVDWQPHESVGRTEYVVQVERERDEARAEVAGLREAVNAWAHTAEWNYRRGAEAMREAAARELDRLLTKKKATAIWVAPDEIRALPVPVPEDKP